LNTELRQKVKEISVRLAPTTTAQLAKEETEVTAKLRKNGMTITEPTPAEMERAVKVMSPFWEEWAKNQGATAEKALGEVRKALGR
jgi:TRAP-type C4-dicarboxylate transport system substrate-binding protein